MSTQASRSRARFKDVEKEVAKCLTDVFSTSEKFYRIPITGRTGPDITVNETNLVIDVKSRLVIPNFMFAGENVVNNYNYQFFGTRIENLTEFPKLTTFPELEASEILPMSNLVLKWWNHMDEWAQKYHPGGIATIILHRSRMPIGQATVVIHQKDRSELCRILSY